MSTLAVGTIKSASGNPPTIQNSSGTEIGTYCRAWANFRANNGTLEADFNVSSITDNGTGDWTVVFSNAMPDANYTAVGNCCHTFNAGNNDVSVCSPKPRNGNSNPLTTSSCRFVGSTHSSGLSSYVDMRLVTMAFFR